MESMNSGHPTSITDTRKRLEEQVAIVTGGASGIGASTVRLFAEHGARVIIADIQDELGESLAEELGESVRYVHCSVCDEEEVRALVEGAIATHGKLDIMYNNAGILDRYGGSILETTGPELDRVLEVNLWGGLYGAKHAARVMAPRGRGCILFTASSCTSPIGGLVSHPYVMSKYGVMGLVNTLSAELRHHGIRVNCISPSGIRTRIRPFAGFNVFAIDLGKLFAFVTNSGHLKGHKLTAECVARAALYLASDDGVYVTGHNLLLDGGYSAISHSSCIA